jgi:hypothetical protein
MHQLNAFSELALRPDQPSTPQLPLPQPTPTTTPTPPVMPPPPSSPASSLKAALTPPAGSHAAPLAQPAADLRTCASSRSSDFFRVPPPLANAHLPAHPLFAALGDPEGDGDGEPTPPPSPVSSIRSRGDALSSAPTPAACASSARPRAPRVPPRRPRPLQVCPDLPTYRPTDPVRPQHLRRKLLRIVTKLPTDSPPLLTACA